MKNWKNLILGICAVGLLFICWRSIRDTEDFDAEVAARENVVKARLMEIRSAEEAYKAQHDGEYCADWTVLINFVKNGKSFVSAALFSVFLPEIIKGNVP